MCKYGSFQTSICNFVKNEALGNRLLTDHDGWSRAPVGRTTMTKPDHGAEGEKIQAGGSL